MPNTPLSTTEALNKISSAAASFLSSLNSGFEGGMPGVSLFDHLLADLHTSVPTPTQTSVQTQTTTTSTPVTNTAYSSTTPISLVTTSTAGTSATVASTPSAEDVAAAWRDFIAKWQSYKNSASHSGQGQTQDKKSAAQTTTPSTDSNTSSGTTQLTSHKTSSTPSTTTDSSTTTSDASSSTQADTTSSSTPVPTLNDLLAQLQSILQMLQKQIQNAKTDDGTTGDKTTSTNTSGTDATTDINALLAGLQAMANPDVNANAKTGTDLTGTANTAGTANANAPVDPSLLAAADMLSELFLLARFAEKKLNGPAQNAKGDTGSASDTSSSATTQTASATDPATLDVQLRTDLKTLLDSVKNSLTPENAATTAGTVQDQSVVASSSSATTSSSSPSLSSDVVQNALTVAEDFLKQLGTVFNASVSATPTPPANIAAPVVDASLTAGIVATGKDTSSPDTGTDADAGTDTTSGNTSGNTASAGLSNAAETTKSSNPYSFASQLSAARAANGGQTGLPSAVEQVMIQLSRNVRGGNDQMTLQLQPLELGKINIKLSFASDGSVQGTVVAHNTATLDMLQKDSRSLERALQEAGLRADPGSLQFSLGGQNNNSSNQTANDSSSSRGAVNANGVADDDTAAADSDDTTDTWILTPNRVNLKV